jgi:heme A synthase
MKLSRFAIYAWGVVAFNLAVILWGAYVRASGSGAGCGSHWPLCNGEVLPSSPQMHTLIEFTHRVTSSMALLLVVGLIVWAFRAFPRKHPVRAGAVLSLIFILTEALIGAGLVIFDYVAGNASLGRALFMSVHLVNTFVLLAVMTLTAWWVSGGKPLRLREQGGIAWLLLVGLFGMLVLAVSGAVAALGDTLFPVETLAAGLKQDFSPTAHFLLRLRLLHPGLAVAVGCVVMLVAAAASFSRPTLRVRRSSSVVIALVFTQLGAGLLNLALLAPVWLQLVHLLLADLVWIALVILTASTLAQPATNESFESMSLRQPVEL